MPNNANGIHIIMWLPVIPLTENVLSDAKKKKKKGRRCDWGLVGYGSSSQALPRVHTPPVMSIHKVSTCHLWNKDQEHQELTKTFGGCLSPDKNLCKKKKSIFHTV